MAEPGGRHLVAAEEAGERIDRFVARLVDRPRTEVQRWIAEGRVHLDGRAVKPSTPLAVGATLEWSQPPPRTDPGMEPEAGDLVVLFEDADLAVLDKPAGLAVHPGAGRTQGTLAHRLLHRYPETAGVGGPGRPGIVHRLDRGTTGLLLVARSERAYRRLTADFAAREVEKTYLAVVYGSPPAEGRIDLPIGRHPDDRKRMSVRPGGRPARTGYRRRAAAAGIALLEVDLETGRTHQIRVHLKAVGHPLVGDPVYGEARWHGLPRAVRPPLAAFPRPALHAWRLAVRHPADGRLLRFEAAVPADLEELWTGVTGGPWPGGGSP